MNIIILGGTGFLGYHIMLESLRRGHTVTSVSIPDIELGDWYPAEVNVVYGDVFNMDKTELVMLLQGHDALVYAVGPDDRILPDAPAYDFFHERLVIACTGVIRSARAAGIKTAIIAGSYFTWFARQWPGKHLETHHAYIRCRTEQAESAILAGGDEMAVTVLELPFIFGTMPGRDPIWKALIVPYLQKSPIIFFPKGGTNMISVQGVAEAFLGAIENSERQQRILVGDTNMTYRNMLGLMLEGLGIDKPIVLIPRSLAVLGGWAIRLTHWLYGKESGLEPVRYIRNLMTANLYFPTDEISNSLRLLDYTATDIRKSIKETMHVCQSPNT